MSSCSWSTAIMRADLPRMSFASILTPSQIIQRTHSEWFLFTAQWRQVWLRWSYSNIKYLSYLYISLSYFRSPSFAASINSFAKLQHKGISLNALSRSSGFNHIKINSFLLAKSTLLNLSLIFVLNIFSSFFCLSLNITSSLGIKDIVWVIISSALIRLFAFKFL